MIICDECPTDNMCRIAGVCGLSLPKPPPSGLRDIAIRAGCEAALGGFPCRWPGCHDPMDCPAQREVRAIQAALDIVQAQLKTGGSR